MTQIALVPHLIRKDLRHVGILFAVWGFLLLVQGALIGSGFNTSDMTWQIIYTVLAMGIPMLQALVIIILVPILIQDEPLAGDRAFWLTRPISRSTLLTAKTAFIALFLVAPPLVVEILIFAANGILAGDIARAIPQVLYLSLTLIIPIAALATLTPSFAKFALWLVVTWVTGAVVGGILQIGRFISNPDAILEIAQNTTLLVSAGIVAGICTIVGGLVVIIHQYLTRKTRLSVLIFAATYLLSMSLPAFWTYDFLKEPEPPANAQDFPSDTVTVSLKPNFVSSSDSVRLGNSGIRRTTLQGTINFGNVPPGYLFRITDIKGTLSWPNGPKIHSSPIYSFEYQQDEWWPSAISYALDGIPVINSTDRDLELRAHIFELPTTDFQQQRAPLPTLDERIFMTAKKLTVQGRVPLREGARMRFGSRQIEIAEVLKQSTGCRLILHERTINLWSTKTFQSFSPVQMLSRGDSIYLLVNRQRNEAVLAKRSYDFDFASMMLQINTPLINRSVPVQFTGEKGDKDATQIDDAWLADAELVLLSAQSAGSITRELHVENFQLKPKRK